MCRSILIAALLLAGPVAAAEQCGAGWTSHASLTDEELSAGEVYVQSLSTDFILRLTPATYGWTAGITDDANRDLSVLTPPIDSEINPRFIEGWHFRNAANTGANEGDVNAPQYVRQFIFSPQAPDIYKRYGRNVPADAMQQVMRFGRGTFTINDIKLKDTQPGQRAKIASMTFDFCLEWSNAGSPQTSAPTSPQAPVPPPTPVASTAPVINICGLPDGFKRTAYLSPGYYEADFDGDAKLELAMLITRISDGKRGIAVCWPRWPGGKRRDVLGIDGEMDQLVPAYFDSMTFWRLQTDRNPGEGMEQGAPPKLAGDSLLLAKEESSSVLLYWDNEKQRFWSYWQGD